MKRLLLMALSAAMVSGVNAQQKSSGSIIRNTSASQRVAGRTAGIMLPTPEPIGGTGNKGTATPFVTEDFSSGSATALPTGWTATNSNSNTVRWHWTNVRASGSYSIPALASTSAANGWMIFDSDSAGGRPGFAPPLTAYLTSPSYNCTGHANINLTIQQYFRKYQDTCSIDVSGNGGTTWTHYVIGANQGLASSDYLPTNPYLTRINISSVAGNQANVKIRFNYTTTSADGSYNWLVDDLTLVDMDATDVGIAKGGMLYSCPEPTYSFASAYSSMPKQLLDSLHPFAFVNNYGYNPLSNVAVNAKVFRGATQVYNQNATYAALPVSGFDSLVEWSATTPGFKDATVGSYTSVFTVTQTGDAYALDNVDTFRFATTDTVMAAYGRSIAGSNYLHRPSTATGGEASFYFGSRFDIPVGKSDTVTSISGCFNSATTPGVVVKAQIYKLDMTNSTWGTGPISETFTKTLTAADISTTSSAVFTTLSINSIASGGPVILEEGVYAVVFLALNAPATSTVVLNYTTPLYDEPGMIGFAGQSSDASADGSLAFADGVNIATGLTTPALMTMNFGTYQRITQTVGNTSAVTVGSLYPNPANTQVNIPVTTKENVAVTVSMLNTVGQVLDVQNMGTVAANAKNTATFNTATLANGVYYITIAAGEHRTTRKFVVAR